MAEETRLAVVLVRGVVGLREPIKHTLRLLRLYGKNHCVVIPNTPIYLGMLKKVRDYVTWGEVTNEVVAELVAKRGEEWKAREQDSRGKYSYRFFTHDGKKYKPYFRLQPPRKGFGRKGVKISFTKGGALGPRGDKMADLLRRMY
jgi:large subunit ribosomal protein L30